jgi:glycosyltransferase involved in cell wall biosynthesis
VISQEANTVHVAMVSSLPLDRTKPTGGPNVVTMSLIRALVKLGVRVTAIEWGSRRHEAVFDDHVGCEVVPVRKHRPALLANWLATARDIQRIVEDLRPDVVHVQAVAELGRLVERPKVLTVRGISYRDEWLLKGPRRYVTVPIMKATFHWCVRMYGHLIAISPYTLEVVRLPSRVRVHKIPNPPDDGFFALERQETRPVVLVVGLLSELKNTMGVVQAAARVRHVVEEVQFRIAGPWRNSSAEYARRVEEFCRRENLQQTVQFLGPVGREELMCEMSRASCLLLPSFQENSPVVIAEALAAGVPVAASRICGIPFLIREGETGLLFDPHRGEEIVDSLTCLLGDDPLRRRMGTEARRDAEQRFRLESVARRHVEVYEQAIQHA